MPLYEYHCLPCDSVFEELCSLGEASKKKPCPSCGNRAPRIVSAFAISSGASGEPFDPVIASQKNSSDPRPLCMQHSQIPLACHMDEYSVKRFAAHASGRGNAFDDKVAEAKEVRKQRGITQPKYAPATHGHDHDHGRTYGPDRNFRRHGETQVSVTDHRHDSGHDHAPAGSHSHRKGKTQKTETRAKQQGHVH